MQRLLLAGACWAFWLIYVIVTAKTELRHGVVLWPLIKLTVAGGVAWFVGSAVLRAPPDDSDQDEEPAWRPMPLLVRVVLAAMFFAGGVGITAMSMAGLLFGTFGVVAGLLCFPIAIYFLVAGKYNPTDVS